MGKEDQDVLRYKGYQFDEIAALIERKRILVSFNLVLNVRQCKSVLRRLLRMDPICAFPVSCTDQKIKLNAPQRIDQLPIQNQQQNIQQKKQAYAHLKS